MLARRLGARSHQDDHPFGVVGALVVEQAILPAGERGEGVHDGLHVARQFGVERVHRLAGLKERVRVVRRTADEGVLGVERTSPMRAHQIAVDHRPNVASHRSVSVLSS